jgi:hypothetical protein
MPMVANDVNTPLSMTQSLMSLCDCRQESYRPRKFAPRSTSQTFHNAVGGTAPSLLVARAKPMAPPSAAQKGAMVSNTKAILPV